MIAVAPSERCSTARLGPRLLAHPGRESHTMHGRRTRFAWSASPTWWHNMLTTPASTRT